MIPMNSIPLYIDLINVIDSEKSYWKIAKNGENYLHVKLIDDVEQYFDYISCVDYAHCLVRSLYNFNKKEIILSEDIISDCSVEFLFNPNLDTDMEIANYIKMKYGG